MTGTLYLVSTPIGNLKDMTLRAIEILKSVSLILVEDTRVSRKLLSAYEIYTPLLSNFAGNESRRIGEVVERLRRGEDIALITDAGTPSISDPGFVLVRACRENQIDVYPIPGASSLTSAISVSGFPDHPLLFLGFAPKKEGEKTKVFNMIKDLDFTIAFFESPLRIRRFLAALYEHFPERDVFLAREMTKKFESYLLNPDIGGVPEKGEFAVLLSPPKAEPKKYDEDSLRKEFETLVGHGTPPTMAVKEIAKRFNISKRLLYNDLIVKGMGSGRK